MKFRRFFLVVFVFQLGFLQHLVAQVKFNFGLTVGNSISGTKENSYQNEPNWQEMYDIEVWNKKKLRFHFYSGLFGKVSYENISLQMGLNRMVIGEYSENKSRVTNLLEQNQIQDTYSKNEFSFEYLQVPVELEIRFKIFKIRPFILLGYSPAFMLNEYFYFERSVNDNVYWIEGQFIDSFEGIFTEPPVKSVSSSDYAFTYGGGFYIHPKISVSAYLFKGKKKVFCPVGGGIHSCGPHHNNRSWVVQIRYFLKKQF